MQPIPVGLPISLGGGAQALVVAANGRVYGDARSIEVEDENDRSVALYITYGNFQYILDGDLGGGAEACSQAPEARRDCEDRARQGVRDANSAASSVPALGC